jgi:fimbrial isopeptide formation D2 family protein
MLSLNKKGLIASVATLAMAVGGLGIGAGVANAAETIKATLPTQTNSETNQPETVYGYTYDVYEIGSYAAACSTDQDKIAVSAKTTDISDAFKQAADKAGVALPDINAKAEADGTLSKDASGKTISDGSTAVSHTDADGVSAAAQLDTFGPGIRDVANNVDLSKLGTAVDSQTPTTGTEQDFTVPEAGWYLIASSDKDGNPGVTALVGTACGKVAGAQGELTLKNTNGNLPGDNTDQNPNKSMIGSLAKGNTVQFTLESALPDYPTTMKSVEYKLFDYPAPYLDADFANAKVQIDGTDVDPSLYEISAGIADEDKDMTQAGEDKGGDNFTVDLSKWVAANLGSTKGKKLTVVYTAKVNDTFDPATSDTKTINTFDVDNNGVRIPEGPHDPNPNDPGNDTPDPADGDVKFTKVNVGGNPLAGAKFTLHPATLDTKDTTADVTVESNEQGVVAFDNLGAGSYVISETDAPTGYMTSGSKLQVLVSEVPATKEGEAATVKATISDSGVDATNVITLADNTKDVQGVETKDDATAVKFLNVKNLAELPLTGAAGIVLFVVIAALLAGGATVMVSVSKHNKKAGLAI